MKKIHLQLLGDETEEFCIYLNENKDLGDFLEFFGYVFVRVYQLASSNHETIIIRKKK